MNKRVNIIFQNDNFFFFVRRKETIRTDENFKEVNALFYDLRNDETKYFKRALIYHRGNNRGEGGHAFKSSSTFVNHQYIMQKKKRIHE